MKQYANSNRVRETGKHFKNGASPKSQMSRRKILMFGILLLAFCAFTNRAMGQTWNISDFSSSGNNVMATLTVADSTLTISGNGNMADFDVSSTGIPWNNYLTRIKTVVIEGGVTNIGNIAFQGCTNLMWVTIPEGVTKIGEHAFENCTSLPCIAIPTSVTQIEAQAFKSCTALIAIYNKATTPQVINSNVFQGVTVSNIYVAVPTQSINTYNAASVWQNCHITAPFVRNNESLGDDLGSDVNEIIKGLDGSVTYIKYRNNNPTLPERVIMYDGISEYPKCVIDYNPDGNPERYVGADGTTIFADSYEGNHCNVGILLQNGTYYTADSLLVDIVKTGGGIDYDYALSLAQEVLKETLLQVSIQSWDELELPNWLDVADRLMDTRMADEFLPPQIRAGYWMFSFSAHMGSAAASCGTFANALPLFALAPPFGGLLVVGLGINCVLNIKDTWDAGVNMGETWSDVFGKNNNSGCSVIAKLEGGTLVISGSGALCQSEIDKYKPTYSNGYTDRRSEIKKIIINSGVTLIPSSAFSGYSTLSSVIISNSVTEVGAWAFSDCNNLKTFTIQDGTTALMIGMYAGNFYNTPIETLYLGRNIANNQSPFSGLSTLETVTISNNVTALNGGDFQNCTSLQSLTFSNSITSIPSSCFSGCSSLQSIVIPQNITKIGSSAFSGCTFTSITIPNTVTEIEAWAFSDCNNLKTFTIQDGTTALMIGMYAGNFYNTPIETLYLGRNIANNQSPFSELSTLETVTIGNSVTALNGGSFQNCTGLTQITSNATIPPTLDLSTFYNVSKTIPVYINCNYLSTYQSTQYWSEFTNYQCAVQVSPASNSVVVTFPKIDNAATYALNIYSDENHTNSVTELHLDANGNIGETVGDGAGRGALYSNGYPQSTSTQNALNSETTLSCIASGLSANTRYYFSLTPYNASGMMLTVFTGDFTTTVAVNSIENIILNKIKVYPNPVKDELIIENDNLNMENEIVQIIDFSGRIITNSQFSHGISQLKIKVSHLQSGVYVLKIGNYRSKFVKE